VPVPIEVLDPTWGDDRAVFVEAAALGSIEGATIGIVSNGKQGTRPFFAALADELTTVHRAGEVVIVTKSNYSAPAEAEVMDQASEWNALISGLGD
jgi:hypothetical protein